MGRPDHSEENELERLVEEVRTARERLARLMETTRREREQWPGREHRWEQWRAGMRHPHRRTSDPRIH
jgi:hypothetical protein